MFLLPPKPFFLTSTQEKMIHIADEIDLTQIGSVVKVLSLAGFLCLRLESLIISISKCDHITARNERV